MVSAPPATRNLGYAERPGWHYALGVDWFSFNDKSTLRGKCNLTSKQSVATLSGSIDSTRTTMHPQIISVIAGTTFVGLISVSALAANLEQLQGNWALAKTNQEGQAYSQLIEIHGDQFSFQIVDAQSRLLLVSKGTIKATKTGPFDLLSVTGIQAGRAPEELQAVDDTRSLIYTIRDGKLIFASNFDKERENETPTVESYTRTRAEAQLSNASGTESKLVGKWKMQVTMGPDTRDYELRITKSGEHLEGTLVSPRSGEHKCKAVQMTKGDVRIEVDREIQGNQVTFVYQAKLAADGLSGKVQVKGYEDQFNGTWNAAKQ
jgi:hypothetical protein